MGFDNDCIINIQSLAGDYFCPVCRLLVLPNEALQSQCCTHLYCKPCFMYVVTTTRVCRYDGFSLTEADSKPLIESNKTLAETIGKIAVYCLYRKSGCSWQGILSECTSHCKGCSFGNYPVVCNRCGLQILHRQVEEHAQTCSGMVQPGAVTQDPSATSATAVASIDQNQVAAPVAVIALQPVTSQTVVATTAAGHVANLLPNPTSQTQALCQTAVQPTAEQWYQQQQYQQYNIQHSSMQHSAPVDRISNLPDEILSHIISFLPTKQAFTTTLLSKRWTSLCYSLTDLRFEFDDETVPDGDNDAINRFCRFVDTVMLSPRATNQPIKTFGLNCRSRIHDVDRQSLEAWVEAAKQRSVKEFYLFFSNVTLNPTIFTSHTLVVLKLAMLQLKAENLCVHLPSLKTLYLKFVRFEKQNDFIKLLNACPNLQDLQTSDLRYMRRDEKNEAEEFKSLFLSKLVRADIGSIDVPFNVVPNVKFLRLIREPSLQMNVEDIFKVIPVFKNLIHIELWFYGFFHGWDGAVELLQHCPKLQILFMIKWSSSLCKDWDSPISGLECASSHLRSCTILNFEGSKNDIGFAKYILENARLLQYMTIDVATRSSNGMQKDQIIEELSSCPRMSPGCKLSFQFVK